MPRGKQAIAANHEFVKSDAIPANLDFGERARIHSPYDVVLVQLRDENPDLVLKFDSITCRASLKKRAYKLGMKLSFAEHGSDTLYVRLARTKSVEPKKPKSEPVESAVTGQKRTVQPPHPPPLARIDPQMVWTVIKEAIYNGMDTTVKISIYAATKYARNLKPISDVEPALKALLKEGSVRINPRGSRGSEDRYELTPIARAEMEQARQGRAA